MTELSAWDNTRVSTFKMCPRKFLYSHIYDWQPESKSLALTFGSAWHAAMDTCWGEYARLSDAKERLKVIEEAYQAFLVAWLEEGGPDVSKLSSDELDDISPRTPMIAREMLAGYIAARMHLFSDPSFKLLAIEQPFAVPLDPNDPSRIYVGRIDKIFEYRKQVFGGEHKTSTSYKKGGPFRADFVDSFSPNAQVSGYIFALRMMYGKRAAGVWVDASLVHKTDHSGFKIIPCDRQDALLDEWLWETQNYIDQIEGNKAAFVERRNSGVPYLAAFPKNTGSCSNFGGCSYLDLCRTTGNPEMFNSAAPLGYKIKKWDPLEKIDLTKLNLPVAART